MKTSTLINRKLLLVVTFLCSITFGIGQTTLSAGEVVITGFNSDNPDEFTFVLLTDILATTQIKFTDKGWVSTTNNFWATEGILTWTAAADLSCGTEITVTDGSPFTATIGTITDTAAFALATAGDQILVFQGPDATPTFIYGVHFGSATGWTNAISTNTSAIPSGLTDGGNAVYIGNFDNGNYNCSVTTNSVLILSAISTSTNWNGNNTRIGTIGGCVFSCPACAATTTWNGTTWNNGNPNATTEAIINANYSTSTDLPGSFNTCSLTVNNGGRLLVENSTYVEIENNVTVNLGGELWVEPQGSFVQNSDASTFTDNTVNGSLVRKRTTQLVNWFDYTYWSSPVVDERIGTALAFSNPTKRFWFNAANYLDVLAEIGNTNTFIAGSDDIDDNGDDWQLANVADIMTPGVGYAATHDNIGFVSGTQYVYTFYGAFNNGVITTPIAWNGANGDNDWNFIGNPYPCAIDSNTFFTINSAIIGGAAYLWSHATAANGGTSGNENENYAQNDYALILASGVNVAGGDGIQPNNYIPSGQGFFVQGLGNGNVTFNNSMRMADISSNSQFFRSAAVQEQRNGVWMNLTSDNGVFNQVAVAFIVGATDGNDGIGYDAIKNLSGGNAAMVYSLIEGEDRKYAVQSRHPESLTIDEVIELGFNNNIEEDTQFTLSVAQLEGEFMNENTIYLKDNLLDIYHNLSESDYTFTSEVGEFNERFEIRFASTLSIDEFALQTNELIIVDNENIGIDISTSLKSQITKIKIYDLLGRELQGLDVNNKTLVSLNTLNMSTSVYIAKVSLLNGQILTKKILM